MVSIWSCIGKCEKGTDDSRLLRQTREAERYTGHYMSILTTVSDVFQYSMAVLVLKQCHELRPDEPMVLLHAAKLCINNLHQVIGTLFFNVNYY